MTRRTIFAPTAHLTLAAAAVLAEGSAHAVSTQAAPHLVPPPLRLRLVPPPPFAFDSQVHRQLVVVMRSNAGPDALGMNVLQPERLSRHLLQDPWAIPAGIEPMPTWRPSGWAPRERDPSPGDGA